MVSAVFLTYTKVRSAFPAQTELIENLVEITDAAPELPAGYLKFKNLTLIPIDKRLINKYLLNDGEIDWLNNYHRQVEEALSPYLTAAERNWLQEACSPL